MKSKRSHARYSQLFFTRKNKSGGLKEGVLTQVIFIVIIFGLFVFSMGDKINSRGVRQDIIETQSALFIEAAVPGMSFEIFKVNANGLVDNVRLEGSKIFVDIDGLNSLEGRSYFSAYNVKVIEEGNKFLVIIS